ncbi:hypothetical protein E2C01_014224 [Portunus trituberculatus]|uniref:Uncharacterized protein n=1 Tax=Portunus trituberculatus TaxID=210409 RepID=A0A5B7DJU7_PORTR|nr:hypothetical protein [Portunus trituberculatus]
METRHGTKACQPSHVPPRIACSSPPPRGTLAAFSGHILPAVTTLPVHTHSSAATSSTCLSSIIK